MICFLLKSIVNGDWISKTLKVEHSAYVSFLFELNKPSEEGSYTSQQFSSCFSKCPAIKL